MRAPDVQVHIAGAMIDGIQLCTRCGKVLIDYRDAAVMVMPGEDPPIMHGWSEGAFVAQCGSISSAMKHDAQADDEMPCATVPMETQ